MSKSLGNFYTLPDLQKKGLDFMAVRYELLPTHYRQKLNFTFDGVKAAKNTLSKIQDFILKLKNSSGKDVDVTKLISSCEKKFVESLDDDLNISGALASLHEFMNSVNKLIDSGQVSPNNAMEILEMLEKHNSVYGFMTFEDELIPEDVKTLADKRESARKKKEWKKSDEIREEIKSKGYSIADTKDGYTISKI